MTKKDPQEMSQAQVQQKLLEEVTEAELERELKDYAEVIGWLRYHTLRSKGSNPGFPDDVFIRERIVWVECKRENGKLTEYQEIWRDLLSSSGSEYYVCRPSNLAYVKQRMAIWKPSNPYGGLKPGVISDLIQKYKMVQLRAKAKKIVDKAIFTS